MTIKLSGNYHGELWAARCQKIVLRPARLHLIDIQSVSLCQALNKAIGSAGCTVLHNLFGVGVGGKSGILFSCDSNGGDKCKQWKCCMHCCSAVWFSQLNHRNINRCPFVHCTGYQHTFMRTTPQSADSICSTCIRLRHQDVWRLVGLKWRIKVSLSAVLNWPRPPCLPVSSLSMNAECISRADKWLERLLVVSLYPLRSLGMGDMD